MPPISRIAGFIQLTVAPVFLLSAVAAILVLLSARLGRIVDRARVLEERLPSIGDDGARARVHEELHTLERRSRLIQWALTLGTVCAPLTSLVIAFAFLGLVLNVHLGWAVAALFIGAIMMFTASLLVFLREVFVAMATLRIGLPVSEAAGARRLSAIGDAPARHDR